MLESSVNSKQINNQVLLCVCDYLWSGVLMWEVYSEGRLPYGNKNNAQVVDLLNEGIRLLKPRLAPKDVQVLMEWCWKEVSKKKGNKRMHLWPSGKPY